MIKALKKLGTEILGMYLNIIKTIYSKPTATIKVNGRKTQKRFQKSRNKTRVPTLSVPLQGRN